MVLMIKADMNIPNNCYECKYAERRIDSDRECRCGLLGYGITMDITRGAKLERHPSCPILGEIPDEHDELIDKSEAKKHFQQLGEMYDLALQDCDLEKEVYPHYGALMRGKKAVMELAGKLLDECKVMVRATDNKSSRLKFISYDGKYPNLCSGTLVISLDGIEYSMQYCICSGGSVWFDDNNDEHVDSGEWKVYADELPVPLRPFAKEIERLVNENVEHGCCGGCV